MPWTKPAPGISRSLLLTIIVLLFAQGAYAGPMSFNLYQDGFTGGGFISGSFSGEDLNSDGAISFFDAELTAFSADWSGNAFAPATTWELVNIFGLTYELGTGDIGDDGACCLDEGVLTNATNGLTWISGNGPAALLGAIAPGGKVDSSGAYPSISTANMITVSRVSVPVPATTGLISTVLLGMFGRRLRYRRGNGALQD